jgi:predicted metal-binding protein
MKGIIEGRIKRFDPSGLSPQERSLEVKYKAALIKLEDLFSEEAVEKCRPCENYGKNYSCPPLAPLASSFKEKYIFAYLFYTERSLAEWENLCELVFKYGLEIESYLDGECLIAGNCKLCKHCKAESAEPCAYPEKLRYSFSGVGLDAGKLSKFLKHEILWGKTPEYISAVGGCLTNREEIKLPCLA